MFRAVPQSRLLLRSCSAPAVAARSLPARLLEQTRSSSSSSSTSPPKSDSSVTNSTASSSSTSIGSTGSSAGKNHLTSDEEQSKRRAQAETQPPPYLTRALGVRDPRTIGRQTREEWRADLLDPTKRLDERRHLVKQVATGYYHDYNQLRHKGGKTWIAPKTLIRENVSLYFPDIEGVSLLNKAKTHTTTLFPNKVSLVVLTSFKSSEEHINSFVRPTLSDTKDNPSFQYIQINLQENPLKSFLVSLFLSSLRKTVPEQYQSTYILSHQSLEYLREPTGMENKHVGYVFLVDWAGRIRWAGCDWATIEEEESLRRCSHVLLDRLREVK